MLNSLFSTGLPGDPEDSTNGTIENGSPENGRINKWYYRGRPEEKSFLYEIVANKISGKTKFQEQISFIVMLFLKFISGCLNLLIMFGIVSI